MAEKSAVAIKSGADPSGPTDGNGNFVEATIQPRVAGPRHSILDLAPLELECLSVLWPSGESSVREIHRALAASRPRAYTTVLTIMDRLEQKGNRHSP